MSAQKVIVTYLSPFVLILLLAGLIGLWAQNRTQNHRIDALSSKLVLFQLDMNNKNSSERPVTDAQGKFVYFPELRIELPYDNVTKSMMYSLRGEGDGITATEADISSVNYQPPQTQTVVDCSDLVRIKLEPTPNPYSPHEKVTTVKLNDGRTLQVYEAVNQTECQQSWNATALPSVIAGAFTDAQSY